ncbi:MAG: hypothetical protein AAFX45_09790 [Pseudomonadota bacterium]
MKSIALTTLTAAAAGLFLQTAPVQAASHAGKTCDEETVSMVMKEVMEAPEDKRAMAEEEFAMAKEKMEAGMADDCSGHLEKASMLAKGEG